MADTPKDTRPGIGVDAHGGAVIDPTANVGALVEAVSKRQDDLRVASEKLMAAQITHVMETEELRSSYNIKLTEAEARRIDEVTNLRAEYAERLASAEKQRIDAIRAVDVNAVAVASQRASDQATVLASQVTSTAEALRALVATTAATVATSLQQLSTSLSTRLTTLEQAGYQAQGKQSYADPAFLELLAEVKGLRETTRQSAGKSEGVGMVGGIIAVVVTIVIAAAGIAIALLVRRS